MITALDSNILIDLGLEDSARAKGAAKLVEQSAAIGQIVICDAVLAEVARGFPRGEDPAAWIRPFGVRYDPTGEEAAVMAGRMQGRYEERSGRPRRLIADFLIGAHALLQTDRLLTRDRGFYRDYFRDLAVIEPE